MYKTKDLVKDVAEVTNHTQNEVKEILDSIIGHIENALVEEDLVDIFGFGKFSVLTRPERNGINPATKERIVIPERKVVKFKPYKKLADRIK